LSRRQFFGQSIWCAAAVALPLRAAESPAPAGKKLRAAIIGDTGHGDYGHEHDLIFNGRGNVSVVGVADPDMAGRAKAAGRAHALRQYADYREMLDREKPQLVCVAPRWTDQHHDMALHALRVGAHVYLEKPVTQTLAEADELLAVAKKAGLKIAVAHQVRLAPNILALKDALERGLIGELHEMRAHGKQDKRAGGEDLIVLGVHLFDLLRFFAGDPSSCEARVLQGGHKITLADAHPATENIGLVAGDDIAAEFAFPKGVKAAFTSRAKDRETAGPWGLELIGTKGAVKILMEMVPKILIRKGESPAAAGATGGWLPWREDPTLGFSEAKKGFTRANARVVDDWLDAIARGREPVCSGYAGMKALEMAMAVFEAGLTKQRVEFPVNKRGHTLSRKS
jgi:predicted dehydrogenase